MQEGTQYRPIKIQKLHGAKGFESTGREWAYLLEWTKDGKADLEDDEVDEAEDDDSQVKVPMTCRLSIVQALSSSQGAAVGICATAHVVSRGVQGAELS